MSGTFDPYHRWLGISSKDQPPNHYRLLAIDLFESDPEVIRDAAEQRMAHVRTYQLGNFIQLSQRILNELANAKMCLLDPAKKAAYDVQLRCGIASTTATPRAIGNLACPPASAGRGASRKVPPQPAARGDVSFDDIYGLISEIEIPLDNGPKAVLELSRPSASAQPSGLAARPRASLPYPPKSSKPSASRKQQVLLQIGCFVVTIIVLAAVVKMTSWLWLTNSTLRASTKPRQPSQVQQPTGDEIASISQQVPKTRPPKLSRLSDQSIKSDATLRVTLGLDDRGTTADSVRFVLVSHLPQASMDSRTGVLTWLPSRERTPGEYQITVRAETDGSEGLTDETTFRVRIENAVERPLLPLIGQKLVVCGQRLQVPVNVTNGDAQRDGVVYRLRNAPPWVSIDSGTGTVTCEPSPRQLPGRYQITVRAANGASEAIHDEKTFTLVVVADSGTSRNSSPSAATSSPRNDHVVPSNGVAIVPPERRVGASRESMAAPSGPRGGSQFFTISLPSGGTVASSMLDIRAKACRESEALLQKCRDGSPDAVGFCQDGSRTDIAVLASRKGPRFSGPMILFHKYCEYMKPEPKQYVVYKNGEWSGPLAVWQRDGQCSYLGNYANGQRHGVCCLFQDNALAAVLECSRDKITAVHLITANQLDKSLTDVEAFSDKNVCDMLERIDAVEKDANEKCRQFRERLKQGTQVQIGALNKEKLKASTERASSRARAIDQQIQSLRRNGGL